MLMGSLKGPSELHSSKEFGEKKEKIKPMSSYCSSFYGRVLSFGNVIVFIYCIRRVAVYQLKHVCVLKLTAQICSYTANS